MIGYMIIVHVSALIGLYLVVMGRVRHFATFLLTLFFAYLSGLGITAGCHRLWSHRSYSAKWPFRLFLMICASMANQGSIYHWVRDHRIHHKHSEKGADPHNAHLGFLYAHIGWLLVSKNPDTVKEGQKLNLEDLHKDDLVMWQKRMHPYFDNFVCFMLPGMLSMLWGESYWTGVFVAGALKYVLILHITWLVNSAAHMYGYRPYDSNIGPAENFLVAVLSGGEGYHNWHHVYPFDYAASEFGFLKDWNPTKLVIDLAASVGLVDNRRRAKWNPEKKK